MKNLLFTFIFVVLAAACSKDDDSKPTTNSIDKIDINGNTDIIKGSVEVFYYWANLNSIPVEYGFTIKIVSTPQAGDQTKIDGKTITLDKEYITYLGHLDGKILHIYMAKQLGKVLFPNNLTCINKLNFDDMEQLKTAIGQSDSFVRSVQNGVECPI